MTAFDARGGTDQRFADALSGPDGTGDPSVLMPVLQVYPDALSAPMPDSMVPLPPLDPAALARSALAVRPAMPPSAPQPVRRAASQPVRQAVRQPRTVAGAPVAQPGRYGRIPAGPRPQPPNVAVRAAAAPSAIGHQAAPMRDVPRPWSAHLPSPTEFTDWAKGGFSGPMPHGAVWDSIGRKPAGTPAQATPLAHAPTPPLPRNPTRRNRGSGVWAVFIFLVVIAFASGLGQQLITAISELFNR